MGRRSIFSDPRVIQLATRFVPVTDEVWRLQRGTDPESTHFQSMANQGHYKGPGTRQGIYVSTVTGKLLSSVNSTDADKVLGTLQAGLTAWEQLPAPERRAPATLKSAPRWEASYPAGGLVLRSSNRDLDMDADRKRWNQDHAWFTRAEARGWLSNQPTVGERHDVAAAIVERLARFHVVDNVRGQTLPFSPQEVAGSQLFTTVTAREGDIVEFDIVGHTVAESDGSWTLGDNDWTPTQVWPRSLTTQIRGLGRYHLAEQRFLVLEMVVVGERFGRTEVNSRGSAEIGSIGIVFCLAADTPAERVAPAFVDIYDAKWIVDPR